MSNAHKSDELASEVLDRVRACQTDAGVVLDRCFTCLRSARANLTTKPAGSPASADLALSEQFDANLAKARAAQPPAAFQRHLDNYKTTLGTDPQAIMAIAECETALGALETLLDKSGLREITPRSKGPAGDPQVHLQRRSGIHLSRLVAIMQKRDAMDQRLAHVMDGMETILKNAGEDDLLVIAIVSAQLKAVADSLAEASSGGTKAAASLQELLCGPQDCNGQWAREDLAVLGKVLSDLHGSLERLFNHADGTGPTMKQAEATLWALWKDAWAPVLEAQAKLLASLEAAKQVRVSEQTVEDVDSLLQGFGALVAVAREFDEIAEALSGRGATARGTSVGCDAEKALLRIYTMDEERDVHSAVLNRLAS